MHYLAGEEVAWGREALEGRPGLHTLHAAVAGGMLLNVGALCVCGGGRGAALVTPCKDDSRARGFERPPLRFSSLIRLFGPSQSELISNPVSVSAGGALPRQRPPPRLPLRRRPRRGARPPRKSRRRVLGT